MKYTYQELLAAYDNVGVQPGKTIYVTSDMKNLYGYEIPGSKSLLSAHFNALTELLGDAGTLIVSSRSMQICNTNIAFDKNKTQTDIGAFSEFVRNKPNSFRSLHPFNSYTAIGAQAKKIVHKTSRNSYGLGSPEARMIDCDCLHVSIGLPPNITCSTIHHVELVMGVPYRYVKEFYHPILIDGKITKEPFYMHVWYPNIGIESDQNETLFKKIGPQLNITNCSVGESYIYSYSMKNFFKLACQEMSNDIFIWCKEKPEKGPYST